MGNKLFCSKKQVMVVEKVIQECRYRVHISHDTLELTQEGAIYR